MSRNEAGNQSTATELEIMYDKKYLNGLSTKPLILIRGK
jgi:hypothetical protein